MGVDRSEVMEKAHSLGMDKFTDLKVGNLSFW